MDSSVGLSPWDSVMPSRQPVGQVFIPFCECTASVVLRARPPTHGPITLRQVADRDIKAATAALRRLNPPVIHDAWQSFCFVEPSHTRQGVSQQARTLSKWLSSQPLCLSTARQSVLLVFFVALSCTLSSALAHSFSLSYHSFLSLFPSSPVVSCRFFCSIVP